MPNSEHSTAWWRDMRRRAHEESLHLRDGITGWYQIAVTCPACSTPTERVATSAPTSVCSRATTVVGCPECGWEGLLTVVLEQLAEADASNGQRSTRAEPIVCGTDRGYRQHRRDNPGDPVDCAPCRAAHATAERKAKARRDGDRRSRDGVQLGLGLA